MNRKSIWTYRRNNNDDVIGGAAAAATAGFFTVSFFKGKFSVEFTHAMSSRERATGSLTENAFVDRPRAISARNVFIPEKHDTGTERQRYDRFDFIVS